MTGRRIIIVKQEKKRKARYASCLGKGQLGVTGRPSWTVPNRAEVAVSPLCVASDTTLLVSKSCEPSRSNSKGSKYDDVVLAPPPDDRPCELLYDIHAGGGGWNIGSWLSVCCITSDPPVATDVSRICCGLRPRGRVDALCRFRRRQQQKTRQASRASRRKRPTPSPMPRPSFKSSFDPLLLSEEFWSAAAPAMGLLVDDPVELEVGDVVLAADVVACESDDDVGVEEDVEVELLLAEASCRT